MMRGARLETWRSGGNGAAGARFLRALPEERTVGNRADWVETALTLIDRHVILDGVAGIDLPWPLEAAFGLSWISFQLAIQPGIRPMANITVNMLSGIPKARRMMPL